MSAEDFSLSKKEIPINRIVGMEESYAGEFMSHFRKKFEDNEPDPKEKEKSVEEILMINRVNGKMKEFLAPYGVDALHIKPKNVHIMDWSKFTPEEAERKREKYGTTRGFYDASEQGIAVLRDYYESKLLFSQTLVHEMLHLQEFNSIQRSNHEASDFSMKGPEGKVYANMRRVGFAMSSPDDDRYFFHTIAESIVTELQIRFERQYFNEWPELAPEIEQREKDLYKLARRNNVPIDNVRDLIAGSTPENRRKGQWPSYTYHNEREYFNTLVDDLYERNKDDFDSREDVFDMFARASLTGNLMPIARLIEYTYGEGAFRLIGERTANKSTETVVEEQGS